MDDTYYWRLHPQLLESGRNGHTSVVTENKIIHIGGSGENILSSKYLVFASATHPIEIWEMNEGEFEISTTTFTMNHWDLYPYTFVIDADEYEN